MIRLKQLLTESVAITDPSFIAYIKEQEGTKRNEAGLHRAYKDSVGVWTIGYGHTGNVRPGMTWTDQQAESALKTDLKSAEQKVYNHIENKFPNVSKKSLNAHQLQMLIDFAFNLGGLNKFPIFTRAVLRKDWKTAAQHYKRTSTEGELTKRNAAFYEKFIKPMLTKQKDVVAKSNLIGITVYPLKKNGFVNVREDAEVNAGFFDNLVTTIKYPNAVGSVTRTIKGADGKDWHEVILRNNEIGFVRADVVTNVNPNQYIVQPGDTLTKISTATGVPVDKLKQLNKLTSDMIQPGQKLKLR